MRTRDKGLGIGDWDCESLILICQRGFLGGAGQWLSRRRNWFKSKPNGFEPKIVAFFCNWCTYLAADLAGTSRVKYAPNIRVIRTMCSGRVDPQFVLDAFARGADGVLIGGCHPGDCHYQEGNYKTLRRVHMLRRVLHEMGIEDERFRLEWISASEAERLKTVVNDMVEKVRALGPLRLKSEVRGPESGVSRAEFETSKIAKLVRRLTGFSSFEPRTSISGHRTRGLSEEARVTENEKPKVAFYWCASCGGCEETVLDLDERVLDVVAAVDIVFWPVALDFKRHDVEAMPDGSILAAFVNGAVRTSEQRGDGAPAAQEGQGAGGARLMRAAGRNSRFGQPLVAPGRDRVLLLRVALDGESGEDVPANSAQGEWILRNLAGAL